MAKGNNPERWQKLLSTLDEKLQLGLLDHIRRVESYHFEADVLFLAPSSPQEAEYLGRSSVQQQLLLLVQDAVQIDKIEISSAAK